MDGEVCGREMESELKYVPLYLGGTLLTSPQRQRGVSCMLMWSQYLLKVITKLFLRRPCNLPSVMIALYDLESTF